MKRNETAKNSQRELFYNNCSSLRELDIPHKEMKKIERSAETPYHLLCDHMEVL